MSSPAARQTLQVKGRRMPQVFGLLPFFLAFLTTPKLPMALGRHRKVSRFSVGSVRTDHLGSDLIAKTTCHMTSTVQVLDAGHCLRCQL